MGSDASSRAFRGEGESGGSARPRGPFPLGTEPTRHDLAWLHERVGDFRYEPQAVVFRCREGLPAVHVALYDRHAGVAVGNPFWLECPDLVEGLSALETEGALDRFARRVAATPRYTEALQADHERFARERRRCLDALGLENKARQKDLGVGGVGAGRGLKCLHSHVAFRLASGEGLVGDWALAEIETRGLAACFFLQGVFAEAPRCRIGGEG